MEGSLRSGPEVNPTPIGQVTDFSPVSCTASQPAVPPRPPGPLDGKPFTITPVGLPWKLHADGWNPGKSSNPANVVEGHFEGMTLHFKTDGCEFDASDKASGMPQASPADGSVTFWYDDSTQALVLADGVESRSSRLPVDLQTINGCQGVRLRGTPQVLFPRPAGSYWHMPFDPPQTINQSRPPCKETDLCTNPHDFGPAPLPR